MLEMVIDSFKSPPPAGVHISQMHMESVLQHQSVTRRLLCAPDKRLLVRLEASAGGA